MKSKNLHFERLLLPFFLLLFTFTTYAQSPGLIVRPAGAAGPVVLNPNQDLFTSATTAGFTTNDISQSEILYKIIKPIMAEPTGDLATGPSGGFSDIVKTVDNSGCYIFNDGTNLLFRLRIGSIVSGAKAYNILIDTDLRLGATGPAADPNYIAATNSGNGNSGFEREIALETGTNGRIAIYNVDGIVNPTASNTYSLATNSLISVALSRESGNADYFYDFYVPLSALGITASTPIRIVISTNTNPGSVFQGTRSDIYGLDDSQFDNTTDAWEFVGENTPGFTLNDVTTGGTGPANVCTAAPSVTTGIASGSNVSITGTWARLDASKPTTATISVFKNGILDGTTAATTGVPWNYIIATVASGDVITAKAQSTNESMCLVSNSVSVTSCLPSNISSVSNAAFGTCVNNRRGMAGTKTTNGVIKIYSIAAGSNPVLLATDGSPASPSGFLVSYGAPSNVSNTTWEYNGANNSGSTDPCSGGPNDIADGSYYITITEPGKCESAPIWGSCVNTTATAIPVITQTAVYNFTSTISGTAAASSTVRLFVNGFLNATTTATAGGAYSFDNLALQSGDVITVRAQSASQCISAAATRTATCFTSVPVMNTDLQGNLTAGATTVTGLSSEIAGTTIRVYNASNVLQGTTTVQANGTWSVAVAALVNGTGYYATAQNGTCSVSANSSSAIARAATTVCPVITGSYVEGNTTVSGTIPGPFTGSVYLYQDGGLIGTASLTSQNSWSVTILASNPLYAGGVLTAGAQATNSTLNTNCSSTTTVSCSSPSTPSISPTSSTISVGQTVTYTVSNTQTGVLYIVEDANNGSSYATSEFGNGASESFTTQVFNTPGTYDIIIAADKLSGADCRTTSTASILVTGTLPVELISFNGRMLNTQTQLTWKTATEINSDYFTIERSGNGIHFVSIGKVKASGNSSHEVAYNYIDASPLSALNFYRLKMVDLDGKTSFSSIIKLNNTQATQLVVSPNPFNQVLNIQFTVPVGGEAYIRLFDQHGRIVIHIVRSVTAGTNAIQLKNLSLLPAGNYVLELRSRLIKNTQQIIKGE